MQEGLRCWQQPPAVMHKSSMLAGGLRGEDESISNAAQITWATRRDMLQVMGVTVDGGQKKPGGQRCAAAGVGQYQPAGQASSSSALPRRLQEGVALRCMAGDRSKQSQVSTRWAETSNRFLKRRRESFSKGTRTINGWVGVCTAVASKRPLLSPAAHSWMDGSRTGGSTEPAGQSWP